MNSKKDESTRFMVNKNTTVLNMHVSVSFTIALQTRNSR